MSKWRTGFMVLGVSLAMAGCSRNSAEIDSDDSSITNTAPAVNPAPSKPVSQKNQWAPDCDVQIEAIENQITRLESIKGPYTVATVLEPLNTIETAIADGASFSGLMENVHPDTDIREHAASCTTKFSDLATRLSLSRPIYDATKQVDTLTAEEDTRRYHFLTLQSFRLSGVDRDEQTRLRIRQLNDDITQLGQTFDRNIMEDVRFIEVTPKELAGLPEDYIASKSIGDDGKVQITTRYVDSIPVYTYAHSDEVRQLLRQQDRSRGYPQNAHVLKSMLIKRHELANLLGFDNYADLVTSDKMIGSADNALAFIDRIHELAVPVVQQDTTRLLAELQREKPEATEIQRWQTMYLEEQIRRRDYDVDASKLRQYFPYQQVETGILSLVEHLFDVDIKPWQTDTWHDSVKSFEIFQNGQLLGRFHLDMHPREGKYQHAAAFSTQVGISGKQTPISTLVCNFAGGDDPNEPMEYAEVRTFLHEFGHLLHAIFGGHQQWARLSGIATEWDFAEAPSQMLEEWLYDKETLQTFAINAEGQAIPSELVDRIRASRHFGEGVQTNTQMYYAALSLEYHRLNPNDFDLTEKMIELEKKYSPFPHQEETYFYASLGHLNGYSAIYYTYMWSKVIAMDMFSAFEKNGLRDKVTARHYRDTVLAPGGAKPASTLVADFLGRPYSYEAFSTWLTQTQP